MIVLLERHGIHGVVHAQGVVGDIAQSRRFVDRFSVNDVQRGIAGTAQGIGRLGIGQHQGEGGQPVAGTGVNHGHPDHLANLAVGEDQCAAGGDIIGAGDGGAVERAVIDGDRADAAAGAHHGNERIAGIFLDPINRGAELHRAHGVHVVDGERGVGDQPPCIGGSRGEIEDEVGQHQIHRAVGSDLRIVKHGDDNVRRGQRLLVVPRDGV